MMNSGILINLFSQCFHELSISGLRQPMALFCSHQLRFKLHNLTCPYGIPLLSGRSLGVINTTPETKRQSMRRWSLFLHDKQGPAHPKIQVVLIRFFRERIIHKDFVPADQTMNAMRCLTVLKFRHL